MHRLDTVHARDNQPTTNDQRRHDTAYLNRACKLLKFVSMVSMFLTISGGKQYVFGPIILIINRNWIGNRIFLL